MTMRKSRKSTHPVTNPARSLNARRTKVAAPPVSGRAAVPSAYESETRTNTAPATRRTSGVKPSAVAATIPSAMYSDEAISPYATAKSDGASRTRSKPRSFRATT